MPEFLRGLIDSSLQRHIDRINIKNSIRNTLIQFQNSIELPVNGPAYKLRYRYAVEFWKEKTQDGKTLTSEMANALSEELKIELNRKEGLQFNSGVDEIIVDKFFGTAHSINPKDKSPKKSLGSVKSDEQNPVWYVTCKCKETFFVIKAENCQDEREINSQYIPCFYELIYPGDVVRISRVDGYSDRVDIAKSTGPSSQENRDAKARFIQEQLDNRRRKGESCLVIFNVLMTRCQGIWNSVKNDIELFKNTQRVRDLLDLSLMLLMELSKKSEPSCKKFSQELSSSMFFTTLPGFIENHAVSKDVDVLKSLLEIIVEYSPQTATKVLKVAKYLATLMHVNSIGGEEPKENSTCPGVEYLVHLGTLLAKKVPGYQDVDTTNCAWNELPTIPTQKEIYTEYDGKSLQPIKHDEPYDNAEQYLDINFRLLREECFRDLCTGIQNFQSGIYDPRKMKIYRVTLNSITASDRNTQVLLKLNCEDYNYEKKGKNSSEEEDEEENASNEILYGSLMCISLDKSFNNFIWATAGQYKHEKNAHIQTVPVRLCSERNNHDNLDVLLELSAIANNGEHALMAESPTFYRAFGPSMDRLKVYKKGIMPLVDELASAKMPSPPEYTHDKEQQCDWSIIFKTPQEYDFSFLKKERLNPMEQFRHLRKTAESVLDETQMMGIENFLAHKVSLIQGPPGTGKTFLGVKILRLMLSMKIHERYKGPILVLTYKNVALDHFLEACLENGCIKIVRIGRTKNKKLERICFENVPKKGIDKKLQATDREATAMKKTSQIKLKRLIKCLSNQTFSLCSFFQAASKHHIRSLLSSAEITGDDQDDIEELLSKWNPNTAPSEKLKALVREGLKSWLPRDEIQRRFPNSKDRDPGTNQKASKHSTIDAEPECSRDLFDEKAVARERQQDAVEDDSTEDDNDILSKTEDLNEGEPLIEGVTIPFMWEKHEEEEEDVDDHLDLSTLLHDKERVDFICSLQRKIVREFSKAMRSYEDNAKSHQDNLDDSTVRTLKGYDVIGMTVTGAAIRLNLLDQLRPCAVIVEEAAEIIEGQLLSVLPPTIQHLVMLGDHKQLKPRVNCYQLRKMNLDCSMFERLIKNKLEFQQLGRQCRMRDDIANLLCSLNIYEDLKTNSEKTSNNNPPDCVGYSLLFVKHTAPEKQIKGSNSLWNQKEISIVLKVAEYLMKNNYSPSDVTVLCAYSGQVKKMKAAFEKKSSDTAQEYYPKLNDIYITTVDSFQGEENKVILLSLVRSNRRDKIGFLREQNRICVAISRAQCALYMFGNAITYQSASPKWETIIKYLKDRQLVKDRFPFKEASDRDRTVKDGALVSDTTKLSNAECTRLSLKINAHWKEIAGFADLDDDEVMNVYGNNIQQPEPKDKAKGILTMINKRTDFSRKRLCSHLEEVGLKCLVQDVLEGTLRS